MTYPPERHPQDPGQQPVHPPPADPFTSPPDPYAGTQPPYPGYQPEYPPQAPASPPPGTPPPGTPGSPAGPYPGPPTPAYPGSPAPSYPGSPAPSYPGSPAGPYPGSPAGPGSPGPYQPSEPTSLYPPGESGAFPPPGGYPPPGAGGGYPPQGPGGPFGQAGPPYGPPPKRGRGMLILGIGLAAVLVVCLGVGGVVFLLNRDNDRDGAASPTAAVHEFLQAVYRDRDAELAASRVCSEARDESALRAKIDEISAYENQHVDPRFTWSAPQVVDGTGDVTIVATTVTMVTGDERTADLSLRVSVLDKDPHGWWVCNLETVASESGAPPAEDEGAGEGDGEEPGDAESGG